MASRGRSPVTAARMDGRADAARAPAETAAPVPRPASGARPPAPLAAHRCPLCGGPNDCAVARARTFETPCWCRAVTIAPEMLARVPPAARGRACLCRACAEGRVR